MPTITYISWNIQNFGDASTKYRGNYAPLLSFIGTVARKVNADILAVMELRENGTAKLASLRSALNNAFPTTSPAWCYDWIKGAIKSTDNSGGNQNVIAYAQLDWDGNAHLEGYAVLWRNDQTKFTMQPSGNTLSAGVQPTPNPGGVPANALSLALLGRIPAQPVNGWHAAPAMDPANPPAVPWWGDLNFTRPATGFKLQRNAARRPCYFIINLNIANPNLSQRLCPIVVYHAPSGTENSAPAGTQVSAYSLHLYEVPVIAPAARIFPSYAIASGDFNVDTTEGLGLAYQAYTDTFVAGGAQSNLWALSDNSTQNATGVILTDGIAGPMITSSSTSAYRGDAIDNVLYRDFDDTSNAQFGPVYDLITAVKTGGSLTGNPVKQFKSIVDAYIKNFPQQNGVPVNPAKKYKPVYSQIYEWRAFYYGLTNGAFPTSRSAAEFVKLFISDHLPVVFRFTVA